MSRFGALWRVLLMLSVPLGLVLFAAVWRGCSKPNQPTVLISDTGESFSRLKAERDAALHEASGLRERLADALRGRSRVHVDTLIQYDTIIQPDTVLLYVTIDGDGRASVDAGVKADSGYVPETRRLNVAGCDDGIAIGPSGVVCDKARLGHLEVFASVGASRETLTWEPVASAGFAWSPSFRSTLELSAYVDTRRAVGVRLRKGVRLF